MNLTCLWLFPRELKNFDDYEESQKVPSEGADTKLLFPIKILMKKFFVLVFTERVIGERCILMDSSWKCEV